MSDAFDLRLQNDCAQLLLSDTFLENVNIATRDEIIANESKLPDKTIAAEVLVYTTIRNGRKGCGVIVEKPELLRGLADRPGTHLQILITFLILEDPLLCWAQTSGALKGSFTVGERILQLFEWWSAGDRAEFQIATDALTPAIEFEPLRAWRANVLCDYPTGQIAGVLCPTAEIADGLCALTNQTEGAEIYYTLDESFPARGPSNPGATKYTVPFAVESGTVIRWAAYLNDQLPSIVGQQTA